MQLVQSIPEASVCCSCRVDQVCQTSLRPENSCCGPSCIHCCCHSKPEKALQPPSPAANVTIAKMVPPLQPAVRSVGVQPRFRAPRNPSRGSQTSPTPPLLALEPPSQQPVSSISKATKIRRSVGISCKSAAPVAEKKTHLSFDLNKITSEVGGNRASCTSTEVLLSLSFCVFLFQVVNSHLPMPRLLAPPLPAQLEPQQRFPASSSLTTSLTTFGRCSAASTTPTYSSFPSTSPSFPQSPLRASVQHCRPGKAPDNLQRRREPERDCCDADNEEDVEEDSEMLTWPTPISTPRSSVTRFSTPASNTRSERH